MILPISKYGVSKIIEKPCEQVTLFDQELKVFVLSMFDTMYAAHGVGLAASQVGVLKRIAVIDISDNKEPQAKLVLINPVIKRQKGIMEVEEGCLSIPGRRDVIKRSAEVLVEAQDIDGQLFSIWGKDLLAQALQHEIDHLNGILYITHIT